MHLWQATHGDSPMCTYVSKYHGAAQTGFRDDRLYVQDVCSHMEDVCSHMQAFSWRNVQDVASQT